MTKTKTIVLVSVATLVAVAAGVAVKMIFFPSVDEKFFQARNNAVLQRAPSGLVVVRHTHYPKPPTNTIMSAQVNGSQWFVGRNVTFQMLIALAYGNNPGRIVLPPDAPKINYDFLVTVPEDPQAKMQAAIKRKLGYTAEKETRDTDVLALKIVNPSSDGLKSSPDGEKENTDVKNGRLYFTHTKLTMITDQIESLFKTPVVDKTELAGYYNFSLEWDPQTQQKILNGTLDAETGKKILAEWGLGLVPDTASMEMLVVKKVK